MFQRDWPFDPMHLLYRFIGLIIQHEIPLFSRTVVEGWPTKWQIALVYTPQELENDAILAEILGILETGEKAKASPKLLIDPLRDVAQVDHMVWDPENGQLALVFTGESFSSGGEILKTDSLDEAQALWRFVVEVAFGFLRARDNRVLLAPV